MSDREFAGFTADTVADAVRQPPLDDLRAVARSRRRLRRYAVTLPAAALLVATAAFIPLRGGPGPFELAGPHPTEATTRGRASELIVVSDVAAVAVAVEVADDGCGDRISFAATGDSGRHWSDWQTARRSGPCTATPDVHGTVIADVRYSVLDHKTYLVRYDDQWVLSTDAGQTWQDAASAITAVAAFPPQARLVSCHQGCGAVTQPLAIDPASGRVFRLTGQSPSPYHPFNIYPSPDGAIWITYWPGQHDQPAVVARSTDRGVTWRTSHTPQATTSIAVAAVSAQEAYLLTEPLPADRNGPPPAGPSRLLHTTDGGQSWQDVGTDLPTSSEIRPFTIGSDGSLIVVGYESPISKLLVSRDGGLHFTTARQHDGDIDTGPGRAWIYDWNEQSVIGTDNLQFTTDGLTWTRLLLLG